MRALLLALLVFLGLAGSAAATDLVSLVEQEAAQAGGCVGAAAEAQVGVGASTDPPGVQAEAPFLPPPTPTCLAVLLPGS
jgi:opacity protein-like surface antigen